jgi:predicted metalloprotease with PDZ domain
MSEIRRPVLNSEDQISRIGKVSLVLGWLLLAGACVQAQQLASGRDWPERYAASFGFELMTDHNGLIIVASVDTTGQAHRLDVRPGMEVIGWNRIHIQKRIKSIRPGRYRKSYPLMTEEQVRLLLLTRGRPGEKAEVFFITETGNARGIGLTAR